MPENEKRGEPRPEATTTEEYRSLSAAIAAVTIPAAHVAKPVVTAWANQKFGPFGLSARVGMTLGWRRPRAQSPSGFRAVARRGSSRFSPQPRSASPRRR